MILCSFVEKEGHRRLVWICDASAQRKTRGCLPVTISIYINTANRCVFLLAKKRERKMVMEKRQKAILAGLYELSYLRLQLPNKPIN